tara:strand:- start:69938 stop:70309 length:372 start_codon:yes stop_codon:yes gene_type:complete
MAESAYDMAIELFDEFKADDFFAPAFKPFSWVESVTTGSVFGGGTTVDTTHSGDCAELGGTAKAKMIATLNGISSTDKYIKGKVEEIEVPALNQVVTFDGDTFTVVYSQVDPVGALFELFLRA